MLHLQVLEQLRKDISNTGSVFVAATEGRDETRGAQLVKKMWNTRLLATYLATVFLVNTFNKEITPGMMYTDFFFFFKFCPLIVK